MANKCSACGKFISQGVRIASCDNCSAKYHKGCVALSDTAHISKDWSCPECKKKLKKVDNSFSSAHPGDIAEDPTDIATITTFSTNAQTSLEYVDTEVVQGLRQELVACLTEIRELRKEMAEVRTSVAGLNGRLNGFERRLEALEQRESTTTPSEITELEQTVAQLQLDLNDRDQEALLSDLEIVHLPEEKGENVIHSVCVLAARLGVPLEARDIVFAERIGTLVEREGGVINAVSRGRRIVVRLTRRCLRDQIISSARVRRATNEGQSTQSHRMYINERLTRTNRQLFFRVREECRKQNWRFSWSKRGRIFARQAERMQVYSIRTESDLNRVFNISTT